MYVCVKKEDMIGKGRTEKEKGEGKKSNGDRKKSTLISTSAYPSVFFTL